MASLLAGNIAVPAGVWFATITALPLAFIGAGVLFLPLFIFLRVCQDPKEEKNLKGSSTSCQNSSAPP